MCRELANDRGDKGEKAERNSKDRRGGPKKRLAKDQDKSQELLDSIEDVKDGGPARLSIKKREANFSSGEPAILKAAIHGKHVNGTHFADYGESYWLWRPLCRQVITWWTSLQSDRLHFEMMHQDTRTGFRIILNNREASVIIITPRRTDKHRDGAAPPIVEYIDHPGYELPLSGLREGKRHDAR